MHKTRKICWFSCGVASAVAAFYSSEDSLIVYCDTMKTEHIDNQRFFNDVEEWLGKRILKIKSNKFDSIDDVFESRKFLSSIYGACCTVEMKKIPRFNFQKPEDVHIFGYCFDEQKRIKNFKANNPDLRIELILDDLVITKKECFDIIEHAKIKIPEMYRLGFKNNNCIGCVKASSPRYWNLIRKHFPEIFEKRSIQSRKFNCRLIKIGSDRFFLDELSSNNNLEIDEDLSCGPECK
jgi:hypothetical protein